MDRIEEFLKELAGAGKGILLTNYEGVLAPATMDCRETFPYPKVRSILNDVMSGGTRLIIQSGRSARDIDATLKVRRPSEIWGSDGLERGCNGVYECVRPNLPVELSLALESCKVDLLAAGLADAVESKLSGLKVHWGTMGPKDRLETRARAYAVLQPLVVRHRSFRLITLEEGLELRIPLTSKVDALRRLIDNTPRQVPIAYLGHSIDDEECFRILNGRGLTVLVRKEGRFTAAQVRLQPLDELITFFKSWSSSVIANR